jgi:transcriptional regulator with XRE-family HTH domain
MLDLTDIGDLVKASRRKLGLTQHELAAKSGVSRPRIAALENRRLPEMGFKNLQRILNAVGLDLRITALNQRRPTLDDLVAEEEQETRDPRLVR